MRFLALLIATTVSLCPGSAGASATKANPETGLGWGRLDFSKLMDQQPRQETCPKHRPMTLPNPFVDSASEEMLQDLWEASQTGKYRIHILARESQPDSRKPPQTVVLISEHSKCKSEKDYLAGSKIFAHFKTWSYPDSSLLANMPGGFYTFKLFYRFIEFCTEQRNQQECQDNLKYPENRSISFLASNGVTIDGKHERNVPLSLDPRALQGVSLMTLYLGTLTGVTLLEVLNALNRAFLFYMTSVRPTPQESANDFVRLSFSFFILLPPAVGILLNHPEVIHQDSSLWKKLVYSEHYLTYFLPSLSFANGIQKAFLENPEMDSILFTPYNHRSADTLTQILIEQFGYEDLTEKTLGKIK